MAWGFWRIAWLVLSVICLLWGALPLTASRIHTGCITMIGVGFASGAICLFLPQSVALWQRLWATIVGKLVLTSVTAVACALVLLFAGVSVYMAVAACREAPQNATVIVLGAGLRGERPSRTLRERLDAAVEYLNAHPDAACVLSGGQGADEPCTEAAAMKTYLLAQGIDESRLYLEEQSTSTDTNIKYSLALLEEEEVDWQHMTIVSNNFHLARVRLLAGRYGVDCSTLSAPMATFHSWLFSTLREGPALLKSYLLDGS